MKRNPDDGGGGGDKDNPLLEGSRSPKSPRLNSNSNNSIDIPPSSATATPVAVTPLAECVADVSLCDDVAANKDGPCAVLMCDAVVNDAINMNSNACADAQSPGDPGANGPNDGPRDGSEDDDSQKSSSDVLGVGVDVNAAINTNANACADAEPPPADNGQGPNGGSPDVGEDDSQTSSSVIESENLGATIGEETNVPLTNSDGNVEAFLEKENASVGTLNANV
jgi:hypothetical protein